MKKAKYILLLNILLLMFSLATIMSKLASKEEFLSFRFILCYGGLIAILGIYAIGWQQIIKKLPLSLAYCNKAITIVWAIVWGYLIFKEAITPGKVIGAIMVIAGVVLFVLSDDATEDKP
ncbi:MAG: transporter [Lachnospiraceae bacterium]|nr:transporter [Lachnospiraceae bacterium]